MNRSPERARGAWLRVRWAVPLGLLCTAASVTLMIDLSPTDAFSQTPALKARTRALAAQTAGGCDADATAPVAAVDFGATVAGLDRQDLSELCAADGAGTDRHPVQFVSAVYGTCDTDETGECSPPLEVQTWPACARNATSYDAALGAPDLDPAEPFTPTTAGITGAQFEQGRRIELYTAATTVVVFADDPSLATDAANGAAASLDAAGVAASDAPAGCGTPAAQTQDAAGTPAGTPIAPDAGASSENSDQNLTIDPAASDDAADGTDDDTP